MSYLFAIGIPIALQFLNFTVMVSGYSLFASKYLLSFNLEHF